LRVIGRPFELTIVREGSFFPCEKCETPILQGKQAYRALDSPPFYGSEYLCLECAKNYEIKKTGTVEKWHQTIGGSTVGPPRTVKMVHHAVYFRRKRK